MFDWLRQLRNDLNRTWDTDGPVVAVAVLFSGIGLMTVLAILLFSMAPYGPIAVLLVVFLAWLMRVTRDSDDGGET